MTTQTLNEEQMVHLVRNALLVAGQEMGDGDQWPVVKDTIYKIMKDFEDLKIERNVFAEMKMHLGAQLKIMEVELPKCSRDAQIVLEPKIREFREIYDAYFSDLNRDAVSHDTEDAPPYIERMKAIIATLGDKND